MASPRIRRTGLLEDPFRLAFGWAGQIVRLVFLGLLLPSFAFSQTVSEKENKFVALVDAGENAPAMALLVDLMEEDSTGVYRLVEAAERLILPGEGTNRKPTPEEIQRLFRLYNLGRRHDPSGSGAWRVREALLGLRYPSVFADRLGELLRAGVVGQPESCPLLLYEKWAEWEIDRYLAAAAKSPKSKTAILEGIPLAWQEMSDLLYLRQILQPEEAEEAGRLQQHLALAMRDALPDCRDLTRLVEFLSGFEECASFLILHDLQQCDLDEVQWQRAFANATQQSPAPWMYRMAAARKLNERDYLSAKKFRSEAAEMESHPARKAADLLLLAETMALLGEYPQARQQINHARELNPNWGEPYFQLCDLYLRAADDCKFSAFDRKAIYWLAIDLCQNAQNADPGCEAEAVSRIYRYKQLAPSASETAFKGLKSGDTWPIRCWMSTVTTVKVD